MNGIRTRMNSSEGEGGFTLIELLIVIVILGILAGIAIFAVDRFRGDATTACQKANTRIDQTASAAANASGGSSAAYTTGTRC